MRRHSTVHNFKCINAVESVPHKWGEFDETAVFREVNVPMEIEEISVSKPGQRSADSHYGGGHLPQRYAFLNGSYPGKVPMVLSHEVLELLSRWAAMCTTSSL